MKPITALKCLKTFLLITVILVLTGFRIMAQAVLPAGFSKTLVGSGWSEPVGTAFTKDGLKLFVWEKGGRVYVCNWNNTSKIYVKQTTPVLDISPEVGNWRDHGMLGFALDPNYSSNGLFYVLYVVDRHYLMNFGTGSYNAATDDYFKATIGRITRYKTITSGSNLVADLTTRTILLGESKSTGIPILHESHGIGSLAFAADGTLLASAGDAASYNTTDSGSLAETYYAQAITDGIIRSNENVGSFRSQMLNSFDGKILRIDPVTGNGIASNPYYQSATPRSARSRVWALGFRNPFRFSIKPNTGAANPTLADLGDIYIGDVGWDTYEELNIVRNAASNCGWPLFEGLTPQPNYSACITQNKDEANPLYGTGGCTLQYFRFKNLLKQATADNIHTVYNPCNASTPIPAGGNNNRFFHRVASLDWKHYADSSRVAIFPTNNLATAEIGTAASGVTGTPFRGNCTTGGCFYIGTKYPVQYQNTFFMGDLGGAWMKSVNVQYNDKVQSVLDFGSGFGAIVHISSCPIDSNLFYVDMGDNSVNVIKYGGNMAPVVKMSSNKTYGPSPLAVSFTGNTSYDPDGASVTYAWNFGDPTSASNTSTAANPSHTFTTSNGSPKKYVVTLTVKDASNATSTDSIIISANNTPPAVHITSPVNNSQYTLGPDTAYTMAATVTDAQHGPSQLFYKWAVSLRHNNHQHNEPIDTNRTNTKMITRIGCSLETYYWYIKLTVTDAAGLSTVDSSKIFPNCGSPLPVILGFFGAKKTDTANVLSWITEAEINLSQFEVQRSFDGLNFIPVARVNALRPQGRGRYEYADTEFLPGYNFYRLKMIDFDGTGTYSNTIKVANDLPTDHTLQVYPSPAAGYFIVSSNFNKAGPVLFSISDINGKLLKKWTVTAIPGINSFRFSNLEGLNAGLMIITAQQDAAIKNAKLIINR